MAESRPASGFEKIVKEHRLMTAMMIFPVLCPWELARFCRLNKKLQYFAENCQLQSFVRSLGPESYTCSNKRDLNFSINSFTSCCKVHNAQISLLQFTNHSKKCIYIGDKYCERSWPIIAYLKKFATTEQFNHHRGSLEKLIYSWLHPEWWSVLQGWSLCLH